MVIAQIIKTDTKRIISDSFMVFMYIAPWMTALVVKAVWIYCERHYPSVPLQQYALIVSIGCALLIPMNMGIVLGFQLLEEKEQGIFRAIAVTPLNTLYYLFYHFVIVAAIAIPMTCFVHELLGLMSISPFYLLLLACLAACQIPLQALLISTFARNTLEGFAMMKGTGFMLLVPLLVQHFFFTSPFSWAAAIFPFYWVIRAYQFVTFNSVIPFLLCLGVGVIYSLAICWLLLKFNSRNAMK
jgi:fluoroquinolone transport system permease protein